MPAENASPTALPVAGPAPDPGDPPPSTEPSDRRSLGEFHAAGVYERAARTTLQVGDPGFHPAVSDAHARVAGLGSAATFDKPFDPATSITDRRLILAVQDAELEQERRRQELTEADAEVDLKARALADSPRPPTRLRLVASTLGVILTGLLSVAGLANLMSETIDRYALRGYYEELYGAAGAIDSLGRATQIAWLVAAVAVVVPGLATLIARGGLSILVKGTVLGLELAFASSLALMRYSNGLTPQALAFSALDVALLGLYSILSFALADVFAAAAAAAEAGRRAAEALGCARETRQRSAEGFQAASEELRTRVKRLEEAENRGHHAATATKLWADTAALAYLLSTQELAMRAEAQAAGLQEADEVRLPEPGAPELTHPQSHSTPRGTP